METEITVLHKQGPYGLSLYIVHPSGAVFYGNRNGAFNLAGEKLADSVSAYIDAMGGN